MEQNIEDIEKELKKSQINLAHWYREFRRVENIRATLMDDLEKEKSRLDWLLSVHNKYRYGTDFLKRKDIDRISAKEKLTQ